MTAQDELVEAARMRQAVLEVVVVFAATSAGVAWSKWGALAGLVIGAAIYFVFMLRANARLNAAKQAIDSGL